MGMPFTKEKTIGKAERRRQYDLPLNKTEGAGFLVLLICLMTFLAILALAASFALAAMTDRWSSGLENQVTVEIPAETGTGDVLETNEVVRLTGRANELLAAHPAVDSTHILSREEIGALVEPWLGDELMLAQVPLPGLIAVEIREDADIRTIKMLENRLRDIHDAARIDTHEEWLTDLLRFTGALQFAAVILTLVIGLTTVTAVAGAVRSRMAVHHEEVELLHLMGARDSYISRQFQRHTLILALKGAIAGAVVGALALLAVGWVSGEMGVNLLPDFSLGTTQIAGLAALPAAIALIAAVTARQTVLKVLTQMP